MAEKTVKISERLLTKLVSDVKEIRDALIGTEYNPNGYFHRLECVEVKANASEDEIKNIQKDWKWAGGIVAATSGAISFIISLIFGAKS